MLMKKYYLLLIAAMVSLISFAQKQPPVRERVSLKTVQPLPATKTVQPFAQFAQMPLAGNNGTKTADRHNRANSRSMKLQASEADLITSIPETAEKKVYNRSGSYYAYNTSTDKNVLRQQTGTTTIAFDGDDVYILEPVAGFSGNWVKGTKEGNTITVPMKQLVTWNPSYSYGTYLVMAHVNTATLEATTDETAEAVTYTIGDDGAITQNGTSAAYVLALAWTDDDNPMYYGSTGEFATVFTPYAIPDPVTPPADLVIEELPMSGTLTANGSQNYSTTVKVGKQGTDIYMQGLNPFLPEAWAKGTFENGKATFPIQLMGINNDGEPYYLAAYSYGNGIIPLTLQYDAELNFYTTNEYVLYNANETTVDFYGYMSGMTIGTIPTGITPPEDLQTIKLTATGRRYLGQDDYEEIEQFVKVGIDGTDIYIQGLFATVPNGWVKGTIANGKATFPVQFVGKSSSGLVYLCGYSEDGPADVVLNITDENTYVSTDYILENSSATEIQYYAYYPAGLTIAPKAEMVTAPEDLVAEDYMMTAKLYNNDQASEPEILTLPVKVGVQGNDIYIQGLSQHYPEGWIKGTINGNEATFAPNQYMGYVRTYYSNYDYYFLGFNSGVSSVTFTINEAAGTYTALKEYIIIGSAPNDLTNCHAIYTVTLLKKVSDKAERPANPSIVSVTTTGSYPKVRLKIPIFDVNHEAMITTKLSYQLFTDIEHTIEPLTLKADLYESLTEDMTEIPYEYDDNYDIYRGGETVYLNQSNVSDFNRVGVMSIYRGGGEVNTSDTIWYDVKDFAEVAALKAAKDSLAEMVEQARKALNDVTKPFGREELSAAIEAAQTVVNDSTISDIQPVRDATAALQAAILAHKQANISSEEAEVIWVAAEQDYENEQEIAAIDFDNYLKATLSIGGNEQYGPTYFASGTALRMYSANTLTLIGRQIKRVEFTMTGNNKQKSLQADRGDYALDGNTGTWTGLSDTIVFTVPKDGSDQARIQKIAVIYNQALAIATQTLGNEIAKADSLLADSSKIYDRDEYKAVIDNAKDVLVCDTTSATQTNEAAQILADATMAFLASNAFLPVTVPDSLVTKNYLYTCFQKTETPMSDSILVGFADGCVYIQGLYPALKQSWVRGDFDGQTVTIPAAQFVGKINGDSRFVFGYDYNEELVFGDLVLSYFSDDDAFYSNKLLVIKNDTVPTSTEGIVNYYDGINIVSKEDTLVTLPEGLTAETYSYEGLRTDYTQQGSNVSVVDAVVNIAFDGNDVYLQGLDNRFVPNGWVKGTLSDGKITVKNGQLMGAITYEGNNGNEKYLFYLQGGTGAEPGEDVETTDIVFTLDSQTNTLITDQTIYVSERKYVCAWYHFYNEVTLSKVVEVAATPDDPRIVMFNPFDPTERYGSVLMNIPVTGTNGESLAKDKLFYQLYADVEGTVSPIVFQPELYKNLTEELTVVPFTFSDGYHFSVYQGYKIIYLTDPAIDTYNKIGIKSIYTGAGETHETAIQWYDIKEYTGIATLNATEAPATYVDLKGRKASDKTKGLLIRQTRQADGSLRNAKVVRR
jgi:hypothetical protein